MAKNVYKLGAKLPFEEDSHHEFKGHRNLAVEELPKWTQIPGTDRRSRAPVSRALNGFMNTSHGGTVYVGVTDEGLVKGIYLSQAQMEHIKVSLVDLMSRYSPRVPKNRYKVSFCPILPNNEEIFTNDSGYSSGTESLPDPRSQPARPHIPDPTSQPAARPHTLRTSAYCWCDRAALALYAQGIEMPMYVVEITIFPFVPDSKVHEDTLQLYPVHANEEGKCYFRRNASVASFTHQEVAELTRLEARNHFEKILRRERRILVMYQNLYTSMILQHQTGAKKDKMAALEQLLHQ